jgi:cytochrome c5
VSGAAHDLRVLATAASHAEQSRLLPSYARDAIAAAARVIAAQAAELAELRAMVESQCQACRGAVLITQAPAGMVAQVIKEG